MVSCSEIEVFGSTLLKTRSGCKNNCYMRKRLYIRKVELWLVQ